MNYGLFDQNVWLFPDSDTETGKECGSIALLRNQTGAFQILVDGLEEGDEIAWSSDGYDGVTVCVYREKDVCVNRNTNREQCGPLTTDDWDEISDHRVRRAPYRTYDALVPIKDLTVEADREAYYVTFCPDEDASAGVRDGRVVLNFSGKRLIVPISVKVGKKALPDSTLKIANWSHLGPMADRHGLTFGSDEHIEMVKKYLGLLKECHNNVFRVSFECLKVTKVDGKYVFDFSEVKKWAELALASGQKYLEWAHQVVRRTWVDPPFVIYDRVEKKDLQCLASNGRNYLVSFLVQFNEFLTENGWRDISLVHVSDEPKELVASDYRIICGIFRKYLPGIKLIDAVEIYFIHEALDIYVPKNHYFQQNRNDFEAIRNEYNELWFYTCNMPGGVWLNRYLDSPLLNTRLLHWGNYRYDLKGYLHWAFNHITADQDPYELTSRNPGLPAGDTHIVYPGKNGPLRSLRYMEMKCGIEDCAILTALSQTDKPAADRICKKAMSAFDRYITDTEEFGNITDELFEAYENS